MWASAEYVPSDTAAGDVAAAELVYGSYVVTPVPYRSELASYGGWCVGEYVYYDACAYGLPAGAE